MYLGPIKHISKKEEQNTVGAFLPHRDEPTDKYDKYLLLGDEPRDLTSNARNLFDDTNKEDRKWLGLAREHLINRGKSL